MKVSHATDTRLEPGRGRDWKAIGAVVAALAVVLLLGAVYFTFRPRTMVIRVEAPPGTQFVGNVLVDRRSTFVSGTAPAELTFRGRHLAFNIMPDLMRVEDFRVKLADQESSGEYGVGGWYDARNVVPDVRLQPLTDNEWMQLHNQSPSSPIMQGPVSPAESPAEER